jgi:hypothetical protein
MARFVLYTAFATLALVGLANSEYFVKQQFSTGDCSGVERQRELFPIGCIQIDSSSSGQYDCSTGLPMDLGYNNTNCSGSPTYMQPESTMCGLDPETDNVTSVNGACVSDLFPRDALVSYYFVGVADCSGTWEVAIVSFLGECNDGIVFSQSNYAGYVNVTTYNGTLCPGQGSEGVLPLGCLATGGDSILYSLAANGSAPLITTGGSTTGPSSTTGRSTTGNGSGATTGTTGVASTTGAAPVSTGTTGAPAVQTTGTTGTPAVQTTGTTSSTTSSTTGAPAVTAGISTTGNGATTGSPAPPVVTTGSRTTVRPPVTSAHSTTSSAAAVLAGAALSIVAVLVAAVAA